VLSGTLDQAALHGALLKNRDLGKKLVSVNRIGATGSSWGVSEFKSSQSRISRMNEWHESYPDYSCHSSICVMRTPSRACSLVASGI